MSTETIEAPSTALTAPQRAAVALSSAQTRIDLAELVKKSANIVAVTNADGRTECHAAAMALVKARTTIEKVGKAAREDATAFSKACIAEEKSLVAITAAEEARLLTLRNAWDDARAAEKAEAERLERERITKIHLRLADIRAVVGLANAAKLPECRDLLARLQAYANEGFEEFSDEATTTLADTIASVSAVIVAKEEEDAERIRIKVEQEAERMKLAAEREELNRLRAEQAAAQARVETDAKALRDAEAADMAAKRDAFMAEIAAANKAQQEARAAVDAARAAFEAEQAAVRAQAAAVIAAVTVVDDEPASVAHMEPEFVEPPTLMLVAQSIRPSDVEIVEAVAAAFSVAPATALSWILDFSVEDAITHFEGVAA